MMNTDDLVAALLDRRPSPLGDLIPHPFVVPQYDGYSVANATATLGACLNIPLGTMPPLDAAYWQPLLGDGIDRIIFLIVDALGWQRMQQALAEDTQTATWLADQGAIVRPMTALFPSTTTATTLSLWTGVPPAQHGILGYLQWLREFGVVANMIGLKPWLGAFNGSLLDAGLDPANAIPVRNIGHTLLAFGVDTHILIGAHILNSGLSQITFNGLPQERLHGYASLGDCVSIVRDLAEQTAQHPAFIGVYWPDFDTLSHIHGPTPHHWDAEWAMFTHMLRTQLVEALSPEARRRTLLVITADHGHNTVTPERVIEVGQHPDLAECLRIPPTGDSRAPYLFVREGMKAQARAYIESALGHAFHVLDAQEALQAGLWGPGTPMVETPHRVGDLVLLGYDGYALEYRQREFFLVGRHGSLWPDEAIVPWIAMRLDA